MPNQTEEEKGKEERFDSDPTPSSSSSSSSSSTPSKKKKSSSGSVLSPSKQLPSLTQEERIWVTSLEEALRKSKEDFGKITEFDIALHAIVAKDNPNKALCRLRRLKKFKQTYQVNDNSTVYEAIQIVYDFMDAYPNFLQAFGQDVSGRWVIVFDLKGLVTTTPTRDNIGEMYDKRFAALYYIFHALQPDLDSIRNGTVFVCDCQNTTKADLLGILNGGRALCRDAYPIKIKDFPCLNTPPVLSAAYAMCRPFISKRVKEVMVLDCTTEIIQKHFPKHLLSKRLGGTAKTLDIMDMIDANLKKRFDFQETYRNKVS